MINFNGLKRKLTHRIGLQVTITNTNSIIIAKLDKYY